MTLQLSPVRSFAMDGTVSIRRSTQEGRAGAEEYSQKGTETEANANQRVRFAGGFQLRFDGSLHREMLDSRFGSTENNFDRRTGQAGVALDMHRKEGNLSLSALSFDQRTTGIAAEVVRQERRQLTGTGDYRRGPIRMNAGVLFTTSRREGQSDLPARDQELSGSFTTRSEIPRLGGLTYRFTGLNSRSLDQHSSSVQSTHLIDFSSLTRFAGGRGQASLKASSSFFTLTREWRAEGAGVRLRLPHAGGFLLDDTPEVSDPLEGEGIQVLELYDGNRQNATAVQIGDAASVVREFGGDYRNVQFDFGETVEIVSATVYVDNVLLFPQMFRWRVFFSDDPEGRIWEEAAGAEVTYNEWGAGLQGWNTTLPQAVSARFFKLVDVKLGPTIPDLSITELEVFTQEDEVTDRDRSRTTNHRAGVSLGYKISSSVRAGYDLSFRRRILSGESGYLEDRGHALGSAWNRGLWSVSGRYELRTVEGRNERNTDVNSQTVAVRRGRSDSFTSILSWARVHDQSTGTEKTSHSVSLGLDWLVAPLLRLDQRIIGARLLDNVADLRSTSFTLVTKVTGEVVAGLTFDLQQSERWVSREAGAGFSRFEDTSLALGWRPVPLVSFQTSIRHEVRDRSDWLTRNSITWDPLREGDFKLGFGAHHFRDTRASETQRGGGMQFEWAARPSLTLAGSVEAVRLEASSQENAPINSELRGTWRF